MRLIDADALFEDINKKIMGMVQNDFAFVLLSDVNDFITNAPTVQSEGWVSVPIEPDSLMLNQGADRLRELQNSLSKTRSLQEIVMLVYEVMIQAAPKE